MPFFIAERFLPDITFEQLVALQQSLISTSNYFNAKGKSVHYIRSLFIPGESRCICLFEALNAKAIQEVNEAAQFPFMRIVPTVELENTLPFVAP